MTRPSRRGVIAALGAAGAAAIARPLSAQGPCQAFGPPLPGGTVGLVRGQAARLSVVHHAHGDQSITPCGIVASIMGADGKTLASRSFKDLAPHEARFVDFAPPKLNGALQDTRLELSALVRHTPGHRIGASLQIVDLPSGVTAFTVVPCGLEDPALAGEAGDPTMVPLMPAGTVGIVRGQNIRLSIVHHVHSDQVTTPCGVVAEIFNSGGKLLAAESFKDLAPHQAVFLDFAHPGGAGASSDTRLELILNVRHTPGHHIGATGQVIDAATGVTAFGLSPCGVEDPAL